MLEVRDKKQYRKDYKKLKSSAKDLSKLAVIIGLLQEGKELPENARDHDLIGDYEGYKECHIAPDWLLIYQITDTHVIVARTGSHSQLFG